MGRKLFIRSNPNFSAAKDLVVMTEIIISKWLGSYIHTYIHTYIYTYIPHVRVSSPIVQSDCREVVEVHV